MSCHHFFIRIPFLYGNYLRRLSARVYACGFNRHWILNHWQIRHCIGWEGQNALVLLGFPQTLPDTNAPWWRSHLCHLRFSGDTIKSLHCLAECHRCEWGCIIICLRLNNIQNLHFCPSVLLMSLTEVVGWVSPAWLGQFVKLNLRPPEMLHVMLHHFGDCAHHPAGFVIFAQLAQLWILFIIILIFPILPHH